MHKIKFISGNYIREVKVDDNTNLLSAIQYNDFFIDAPCSGQGLCKKCIVTVDDKYCFACQTKVKSDITVKIPEYNNAANKTEVNLYIKKNKTDEIAPIVKRIEMDLTGSAQSSYLSDIEFFISILESKGYDIIIPDNIDILNKISNLIHNKHFGTIYLFSKNGKFEILDIIYNLNLKNFGAAIDLGTTSISISILNIETGALLDSISFYNPQIMYGADIISRIIFSQKKGGLQILQESVIKKIKDAIDFLCKKNSIELEILKSIVVAGNTAMTHIFLGLNPKFIREFPYTPLLLNYPVLNSELNLNLNKGAKIFIMPTPSNYLGGDMVSGAAYCEFQDSEDINILLDIGTNGEIIIGNKEWLLGCACSAGPAFEGMGLNCGTRYREGALIDVQFENEKFIYKICGNTKPCGISGTGIISLISHLFDQNYIDNRGKFTEKIDTYIRNRKAFILYDKNQTINNECIYVDETDIDNILRAKAAIYSGISVLLKKLSLDFYMINKLYIAGGIGSSLNIDNAKHIGLIPDFKNDKIILIGNSSLYGACEYLYSKKRRIDIEKTSSKITYIDLSNEPEYMNEFTAALFIPHTDLSLFTARNREIE